MATLNKVIELVELVGNADSKTKFVTPNQLNRILNDTTIVNKMATFANVIQLTTVKTNKKDRKTKEPFNGEVKKLSEVGIILNSEYEKNVTNQLNREGKEKTDYKKGYNTMPLDKGDNNNFYGVFKGKSVIEYRPNPNVKPVTKYFLNDQHTSIDFIPDVLPVRKKATNQGTDKEIQWRKLYTSNIVQITLMGVTYKVIR